MAELHGLTAPSPFSPGLPVWPLGPPLRGHTVIWVGSSLCRVCTHTSTTHAHTCIFTYPLLLHLSFKPCLSSVGGSQGQSPSWPSTKAGWVTARHGWVPRVGPCVVPPSPWLSGLHLCGSMPGPDELSSHLHRAHATPHRSLSELQHWNVLPAPSSLP